MKNKKIKNLKQLLFLIKKFKKRKKKIITTNGTFDLIHPAHLRLFKLCQNCNFTAEANQEIIFKQ